MNIARRLLQVRIGTLSNQLHKTQRRRQDRGHTCVLSEMLPSTSGCGSHTCTDVVRRALAHALHKKQIQFRNCGRPPLLAPGAAVHRRQI